MMSLWDALRMNMMISYQELVRTFPSSGLARRKTQQGNHGLTQFDGESGCRKAKTRLVGGFFK